MVISATSVYEGLNEVRSLQTMEDMVAPISLQSQSASDSLPTEMKDDAKRPAPLAGGCRIEGFVRVKKVGTHHFEMGYGVESLTRTCMHTKTCALIDF